MGKLEELYHILMETFENNEIKMEKVSYGTEYHNRIKLKREDNRHYKITMVDGDYWMTFVQDIDRHEAIQFNYRFPNIKTCVNFVQNDQKYKKYSRGIDSYNLEEDSDIEDN